jgi:hypothetical protein
MPYLFLFFRFISIVSMKESLIPLKINTIYFSTTISLSRWWTAMGLIDLPVSSYLVMHMQVYHPNIDLEGNVCLNILREDWNPVLSVNSILYGLQYLFLVILPCPCVPYCTNSFFWLSILPSGCLGLSLQHWFLVHCVLLGFLPLCGISDGCSCCNDCEEHDA